MRRSWIVCGDILSGELDSLILPHVNNALHATVLCEVWQRHPNAHIVMVLDGAGWHASGALRDQEIARARRQRKQKSGPDRLILRFLLQNSRRTSGHHESNSSQP